MREEDKGKEKKGYLLKKCVNNKARKVLNDNIKNILLKSSI
jgi:hypothetical protein